MSKTKEIPVYAWTDDKNVRFESLIVLDGDTLYIANPKKSKLSELAEQIRSGISPATILKDTKVKQVPFKKLIYIKSDRHSNDIDCKVSHSFGKTKLVTFSINKAQRDDLFNKLKFLSSRGFNYSETQYSKLRGILAPFSVLCFISFLFFCIYRVAVLLPEDGTIEIRGRHGGAKMILVWILDIIGPIGVIVVASPFILVGLSMLWKRIKIAPFMMEYRRAK